MDEDHAVAVPEPTATLADVHAVAVDLLDVRDAADGRRIDRDSMPCDTAIHLPDVRRSLSRLREELGSFPGYRLVLFGYEDGFTVNDAWLAVMIDGCDRINEHVHAYARPA